MLPNVEGKEKLEVFSKIALFTMSEDMEKGYELMPEAKAKAFSKTLTFGQPLIGFVKCRING